MKRVLFLIVITIGLLSLQLNAADTDRKLISIKESKNVVYITLSDGQYELQAYNNQIVKVRFKPKNYIDTLYDFGTILDPEYTKISLKKFKDHTIVDFGGIRASININPFSIAFYYRDSLLITEQAHKEVIPQNKQLNFAISPSEVLYGGGARVLGMNRRGNKLQLYNRAHYGYETQSSLMNYSLPMFLSSKKYAVFFDNPSSGWMDLDSEHNNTVNFTTESGGLVYYLIGGNNWFNLVENITELTGRQPLTALWTLGNFSSRFGYRNQEQVLKVAKQFKSDSIALDALIIDIYWFGKEIFGNMGTLNWDKNTFPEPVNMMKSLDSLGVKTILVTEPFVLTTSKRWNEAVENKVLCFDSVGKPYTYDFYFGNTGLIDVFKPEASTWFWGIYKDLITQGVGGWWGDLGEPEVHPSKLKHTIGGANQIHNAYGHQWAKLIYEGYQRDFPTQRPFILMRAGFVGSQRYGLMPWTGDVSRTWGGLIPQTEISLQMGMQGISYMHSDLGGFAGNHPIDHELYVRWLQYGVFQPIFRPHAQDTVNPEPIYQPVSIKKLAREAIELRYELLPYNYNLAYNNHISGKPLMIPLFFVDSSNSDLLTYDESYLWGDAFLVSPVKEAGAKVQRVYFPKTGNWFDFFDGSKYKGGTTADVSLSIHHIPVYVKGGSFIPVTGTKLENTRQYDPLKITMNYYYDSAVSTSNYKMFIDDGKSNGSIIENRYMLIDFTATSTKALSFAVKPDISSTGWEKNKAELTLNVQNIKNQPVKVSLDGVQLGNEKWGYDIDNKTIIISRIKLEKESLIKMEFE